MSINIGPAPSDELRPKIMVVGVGGAGGNAIANMMAAQIEGVDFIVANTDAQALSNSTAEHRIQLGPTITGGLGAGARPEVGKAAAEETAREIEEALDGVNMVFIAAGMGGGTGTGAAPVIAEAARRKGVLTVGVVTKPFQFEGTRRMRAAEAGIAELQKHVDTLIVIPNQNLFLVAKPDTTFKEAFQLADEVLQQGVRSITDLMVMPGLINLDFADVRSVMQEMGKAMMGTGEGEGENRALEAAEKAIANPLLDGVSMAGAKGVIISIIGGEDMKLLEVDEAANHIRDLVDEDANIIWGSAFNPELQGRIRVSVVATGIDSSAAAPAEAEPKPFVLADARPPRRPALDPARDEGAAPRAPVAAAPASAPQEPVAVAYGDAFDESGDDEAFEDVDGIVDPLAGLRRGEAEERAERPDREQAAGGRLAAGGRQVRDEEPLELGDSFVDDTAPLEPPASLLQTKPQGRRRSAAEAGDDAGTGRGSRAGAATGSTLFERMANLSRGSKTDEDDEDDEAGPTLNIPRFLGRQNNQ
ncbi:cell division protein FtsZ [Erythrobacteraceae bacterium CFH 75059]|uniref:cell division protein FtsZ n=1 Tax=Qipengyuania thermophila TaxID=2509361 RepID=UPI00101F1E82|nr:cell division protein FtsZ [Qipengyuania thermophila]TCD06173.1 cell division protein FtsZ [Erythrobacteraceae bacterium CFH 75059]